MTVDLNGINKQESDKHQMMCAKVNYYSRKERTFISNIGNYTMLYEFYRSIDKKLIDASDISKFIIKLRELIDNLSIYNLQS